MRRIPLSARGGVPRAYTVVDDAIYDCVGSLAWSLTTTRGLNYALRSESGRTVYLHRVVCELQPGDGHVVDHINGDSLDNRRQNLRVVTNAENQRNRRPRTYGTSQYRGVYWNKAQAKWVARAMVDYRFVSLGSFDDEDKAGLAVEDFWRHHDARALSAAGKEAA